MKCLNCGQVGNSFLCENCRTDHILEKVFQDIYCYKPDCCENPYLAEYAAGLTEKYAERAIIPEMLSLFPFEKTEYYYCQYYWMTHDPRLEDALITYLQGHEFSDLRSQLILHDLIGYYIPNDFIKPKQWCERIAETDGLCCELYADAAKYYAMIGEYDIAEKVTLKAMRLCKSSKAQFLFTSPENMMARLEKQNIDTERYRTKKPYWPTTEERRRAVAMFYDEKGIVYPRIESKPEKVPENKFAPIRECFDDDIVDYCAFWCSEAFSVTAAKCIYQIGAVKVRGRRIVDSFESLIRPWDSGARSRSIAAAEIAVPLDAIESADDVDIVVQKFFEFVGTDILVSTGALGNQAKLLSRAARYAGMKEICNEFYDLLDLAADKSPEFDLSNNTREYLLNYFSIVEGTTALQKAQANKMLFDALCKYGE